MGAPRQSMPFGLQPLSGGGHGVLDFLRIMFPARGQRLFVAENEQRLGGGLQPPFLERFRQQIGQPGRLNPEPSGQLAEQTRFDFHRVLKRW